MNESSTPPEEVRIIHRYAKNRQLYDPLKKRKITLPEVSILIERGVVIQVMEDGRDATAYVLALILRDVAEVPGAPIDAEAMQIWVREVLRARAMRRARDESDAD